MQNTLKKMQNMFCNEFFANYILLKHKLEPEDAKIIFEKNCGTRQ